MGKKLFRRADLALLLVLLAIGGMIFLACRFGTEKGNKVIVRVDGKEIAEYDLNTDREILIEGVDGTNLLVLEDGTARLEEATCPDLLCVHQGRISRAGESIICLPNRVTVEISGEITDDTPDAVSG